MKMFLNDTKGKNLDPRKVMIFPMVKASMQIMRSAQEFIREQKFATLEAGWFMSGASKRGWTSWLVGAARCKTCVNIMGVMPLVPIVPSLPQELHRQYMAYDGFSFAFKDYMEIGLIDMIDSEEARDGFAMIDPLTYGSKLSQIPKLAVLSSDDEFMMMDWSNIWYDEYKQLGESHLLIPPQSDHGLVTNILGVLSSMNVFMRSISSGKTVRPHFNYTRDNTTGEITVTVPPQFKADKVYMRHAQTLQNVRRDFRWFRLPTNYTQPCTWPFVKVPFSLMGSDCLQFIYWHGTELKESAPGVFKATPPEPEKGYWTGYYVELYFKGDTEPGFSLLIDDKLTMTTPGFTWPNDLPFPDCDSNKGECIQ